MAAPGRGTPVHWGRAERQWRAARHVCPAKCRQPAALAPRLLPRGGRKARGNVGLGQEGLHGEQRQPLWLGSCSPCTLQADWGNSEARCSRRPYPGLPAAPCHCCITSLGRVCPWLKISLAPWGDEAGQCCSPPPQQPNAPDPAAALGHHLAKN